MHHPPARIGVLRLCCFPSGRRPTAAAALCPFRTCSPGYSNSAAAALFLVILWAEMVAAAAAVGSSHSPGEEANPIRHATRPSLPCRQQHLWLTLPSPGEGCLCCCCSVGLLALSGPGLPQRFLPGGLLGWKSGDPAGQLMRAAAVGLARDSFLAPAPFLTCPCKPPSLHPPFLHPILV